MSWAKWDAEHRSAGVRVTRTAADRHKVTSGGKHLGNIEQKSDGTHTAVVKVNGHLQSHTALTHQGALNYIRTTHGLPAVSAKKVAAKKTAESISTSPGAGLAPPKKAVAKKVAAPAQAFHSWNAEHGAGGGGVSSADKIAASIRGALGPGKMDEPKVTAKTGKSGSTISRADESRSTAFHVLKKDMKRPAPVKGEKDAADAFRTKIRMAAYNEKKKQATAADPVNKHTSDVEGKINPHQKVDTPKTAMSPEEKKAAYTKAYTKAYQASDAAHKEKTSAAHTKAAEAHEAAGKLAVTKSQQDAAASTVAYHRQQANKAGGGGAAARSSADRIAAMIKGTHNEQHGVAKPSAAKKVAAVVPPAPVARHGVPPLVEKKHAAGSVEDLANKADEATHFANANPSYVNHQKAYQAHEAALAGLSSAVASTTAEHYKASHYHLMMKGYHRFAADHPAKVVASGVQQEHKDKLADRLPQAEAHQHLSAFTDTQSRRHSQQMYDAIPKASEAKLTPSQKSSIQNYTGSGYTTINAYHRHVLNGNGYLSDSQKAFAQKHTAHLDAAFNKQAPLTHDLVTYRGVHNADNMFGKVGERVGSEFIDHGYTSTASHAAVGAGFGGSASGTLIRVLHPAGSKVLKPSDLGQFNDSEREVLTPRGTRYHIAADRVVTLHNGQTQRQIDLIRK